MGENNKNIVAPENVGVWRLISLVLEFQDTGEKLSEPWKGRQIIMADGTYMQLYTKSGRRPAITQEDQAAALAGTLAVSGRIRYDGNVSTITVELAATPQVVGIESRTTIEITGSRKRGVTDWAPNAKHSNRVTRAIVELERE